MGTGLHIGFTGSRTGTTTAQLHALRGWLLTYDVATFHHGCCVGADTMANNVAQELGLLVVFHPPLDMSQASDLSAYPGEWRKAQDYKTRNKAIVEETDLLIAMPGMSEQSGVRSGTWQTVRMARRVSKPIVVLGRMGGWISG